MQDKSTPLGKKNGTIAGKDSGVDLGRLGLIFIVCALFSLATAWFFSMEAGKIVHKSFSPHSVGGDSGDRSKNAETEAIGPIPIAKRNEVLKIGVIASIPVQTWAFVEGEVLDLNRQYLFSFGKEFWSETGRDSEGRWYEKITDYKIKVTFPEPGEYFVKFKTAGNVIPTSLLVEISKRRGSAMPHLWFGIVTLGIGLFLNEIKNHTIIKILGKLSDA